MKLTFFFLFLVLLGFQVKADHFSINVEDFEVLEIRVHGTVDWTSGPASGSVDCSESIFSELDLEQNGKMLTISWKKTGQPAWKSGTNKLAIHLSSELLRKVQISGSANLVLNSVNKTPDFTMSIAGSGDFSGSLDCKSHASFNIAGSGDINTEGNCQNLQLQIAGSGDFKGKNLKAGKVSISIAGSGDAEVFASNELDVSVSGSGDVLYGGKPEKISKKVSGSGSIQAVP